jgi:hypothetical protein
MIDRAAAIGKVDVPRNGHGREVAGLRIFLDEVAGVERLAQVRKEQRRLARIGREFAIEAAALRTVTDQCAEDR